MNIYLLTHNVFYNIIYQHNIYASNDNNSANKVELLKKKLDNLSNEMDTTMEELETKYKILEAENTKLKKEIENY